MIKRCKLCDTYHPASGPCTARAVYLVSQLAVRAAENTALRQELYLLNAENASLRYKLEKYEDGEE